MKTLPLLLAFSLMLTANAALPQDFVQKKEYERQLSALRQGLYTSKKHVAELNNKLWHLQTLADSLTNQQHLQRSHLIAQADSIASMKASMALLESKTLKSKIVPVTLTSALSAMLALCILGMLIYMVRIHRRLSDRIQELVILREKDSGDVASGLAVISDRIRQCHDKIENAEVTLNYKINSGMTAHDTRILLLERQNAEKYSQVLSNIDLLNGAIAACRTELAATNEKIVVMEKEQAARIRKLENELHR